MLRTNEHGNKKVTKLYEHAPCSKKLSPLMFDNNFGKCGPIFKILYQEMCKKILYVRIVKIST